MAKRRSTEDDLALLRSLRSEPRGEQTIASLRQLLSEPRLHGIVLKSAATLAEQIEARELIPELSAAIKPLLEPDTARRDPGCEGKTAALKALVSWEADIPELFLAAARYRQFEPTFGAPVDSAAELRGLAAIGIAQTRPPDAILLLVDLLADAEKETRLRAAMALGMWRGTEALPLLRLKALLGDPEAEVLAEVLSSLLRQDPQQLDFVAAFLAKSSESITEAAALALGQSHLPAALAPLTGAWPALRRSRIATTLLMAISLLRSEQSLAWLLGQLAESRGSESLAIIDALAIYRGDEKATRIIEQAAKKHPKLKEAFAAVFNKGTAA